MFINAVFWKVSVKEKDDGNGYKKLTFRRTGPPFLGDAQPYSKASARAEYGTDGGAGVKYRAYLPMPPPDGGYPRLEPGDYVRCSRQPMLNAAKSAHYEHLIVLAAREWGNHMEFVLGAIKGR